MHSASTQITLRRELIDLSYYINKSVKAYNEYYNINLKQPYPVTRSPLPTQCINQEK